MNLRCLRLLVRTAAVALAVFALLPVRGESQALPKIVIGETPTDDAAAVLIGVQAGIFRRAGIDLDVQKSPSGAATAAALAGGTYQIGSVSAISAVTAIAKGVPLVMVAPGGVYNSTTDFVATVVKKDSPIQTGRDFNGRTIGSVSLQDLNTVAILNWIDQHGGDLKSVKVVEIPYAALLPALDEGRIDAVTLIQPGLAQGLATGKVRIFAKTYDAIATRFYITTFLARADWAAANPDLVRRFATAMREAEIYANAHKAESAALVAPFAGIELDVISKGGRDTFAGTYMDPKGVQPVIDSAVKYKLLDKPLDANDMIAPAVRGMR